MTDPDDVRVMIAGFRIAQQIAATEPFRSLVTEMGATDGRTAERSQIESYVRTIGSTVFHPCGTCRMGEDDRAVVDSPLRVRGLEGLRVADASVMPAMGRRRTFIPRPLWWRKRVRTSSRKHWRIEPDGSDKGLRRACRGRRS